MRLLLAAAAVAAATALAAPAFVLAQGAQQTVQLTKVDVVKVATGYRASKVIGASVVNESNDTVGKVDDLGVGNKLIVLPYEQLKTTGSKIVLPGATAEALKALPEFKYASS